MFSMPGFSEWILIFAVLVLLFGAKKLPALGGAIGESIKNFKKGLDDAKGKNIDSASKSDSDNNKQS